MPSEASIGVKAAVIREKSGEFHIEDLCLETPRRDEVLVRIAGVGVCHTDLVCRDQYFPVPLPCVFGHEGSGIVESVGESVFGQKMDLAAILGIALIISGVVVLRVFSSADT